MYQNFESDLEVVKEKLASQGIVHYTTFVGNNCVGVSHGRVTSYYIVRNKQVVDVVVD